MKVKTFIDFYREINEELRRKIPRDFLTLDFGARDGPNASTAIKEIQRVRTTYFGGIRSAALSEPQELAEKGHPEREIKIVLDGAKVYKESFIKAIGDEYKRVRPLWKRLKKEIESEEKRKRNKFK